ncbi:MAG: cytochrome c [Polyangiaceae bacterium]|nr:cytochrome c [Polyangiaceae bacterium]
MGCHTILGEGAYYAPELTKVVERRGKDWIRMFLRNPEAMFPNERKMVNYHFDQHPEQIDDLVAFLDWIGHVDTNGFPAKPDLAAKPPSNVAVAPANGAASGKLASAPAIFKELCMGCHSLEGQGAAVGPALDNLSARYTPEAFDKWVSNPNSVKPGTAMPNFSLSPEVRKELASFLLSNGGAR